MSRRRKVILLTGCPRSGTTPVGSNLALAPGARYLYEPFNPNFGLRVISRFYEVPGANTFSIETFDDCVDAIRRVRLDLRRGRFPREKGLRLLLKRLLGSRSHWAYLKCRLDWSLDTVIWKDPTACFAAKAAIDHHQIPVVVTVRPAAAVAASYKRMQWGSGIVKILASLEQIGIDYSSLMADYGKHLESHATGAALLWYVAYQTLLEWAETRPLICFVNLQDTIDHPVEMYSDLCERLGLVWTPSVADKLRRRYLSQTEAKQKPSQALPQRAHVSGRSLSDVNTYGKKLLTAEELRIIEEMTTELWLRLKAACIPVDPARNTSEVLVMSRVAAGA
jgi:hypothetical protein